MKKEPIVKELHALLSCFRARMRLRDQRKEADRLAAGIFTVEEQRQNRKQWKQEEENHAY